jgi:hypothetical protein
MGYMYRYMYLGYVECIIGINDREMLLIFKLF